jgi:chemotaxis protein MotB
VAYADFVTAMMAFFLLMWLINTTSPEQKRGIAEYFAPATVSDSNSGAGGILGGTALDDNGAKSAGSTAIMQQMAPDTRENQEGPNGASSVTDSLEEARQRQVELGEAIERTQKELDLVQRRSPEQLMKDESLIERARQLQLARSAYEDRELSMGQLEDVIFLARSTDVELHNVGNEF